MKVIVVGVTDVPTADDAAHQAAALAAKLGARLHLVSAVSERFSTRVGAGSESWTFTSAGAARDHIDSLRGLLGADIEYSSAVVDGDPAKALCSEAERVGADLIVVGSVRTQGLGRVLGSVASDVLHHAPCAVLVAKTT